MNHNQVTVKLAFRFHEPLVYEEKDLQGNVINKSDNFVLTETNNWLKKNFKTDEDVTKFYETVLEKFKPTNAELFPCIATLTRIKNEVNIWNPAYIRFSGNLFELKPDDIDVIYGCPENNKNISFAEICIEAKKASASEILKKYGIMLAGRAWQENALNMTEEEERECEKNKQRRLDQIYAPYQSFNDDKNIYK